MSEGVRIAVLGIGQMGLVCANLLAEYEGGEGRGGLGQPGWTEVRLWGHSVEEAAALSQTRRSERLEGLRLSERVRVCLRDAEAVGGADLIVSAVPVQHSRGVWERLRGWVPGLAGVVSVAKGIENVTLARPTEVIRAVLGDDPDRASRGVAVLSGPTIAPELARCLPAAMVAASDDEGLRGLVQRVFTSRWLRVYTSEDVTGVELAGAMKNVIAIAAGILDGLSAGNNAKSALLARGMAEISRLGVAMGARRETFAGIAGAGDLATSCFSPEGRNRSLGERLGRGEKLEAALASTRSVVEGVPTTRSVMDLARRYRVEMPITAAVHRVLFDGLDPIEGIGALMSRAPREEGE